MMLAVPKVESTNNSGTSYQDYNPAFGNVDHIRLPKHLHFDEPNYFALVHHQMYPLPSFFW